MPISPYGWSKLMTEIMLRDASNAHDLNHVILRYFNVAGADPQGRTGQSTDGATHLIKVAVEAALGLASQDRCVRHRLSDAGWHLHPRLHPRQRSRTRASRCAAQSARGRAVGDAQLRLRPRLLGARSDRGRQARIGRRFQGRKRRRGGPAIRHRSWPTPRRSAKRCKWQPRFDDLSKIVATRWRGNATSWNGARHRAPPRVQLARA